MNGVIVSELKRVARGASSVADFGCGVGVYFSVLGELFKEVHGFDHSPACLRRARRRAGGRAEITVRVAASAPRDCRGRFDVVLCVNAAVHPNRRVWHGVIRSATALLKPRGWLVLVVPALESAGLIAKAKAMTGRSKAKAVNGVASLGRVPTKHYSRQELGELLTALGLGVPRLRRVEYSWRSHDAKPPAELSGARPFDWIAVARNGA